MKHLFAILFLILSFAPKVKAQNYYSGEILTTSSSYLSQPTTKRKKNRKNKIYIRQTIDSTFMQIDVIIKKDNQLNKSTRVYQRYINGKHYPDFRLFIKKRDNDEIRYIKPGDDYEIDLYDGILRSLLPDFEFFHEKTHRTFFHNQLESRYNIAFDIIKEEEESIFKHKLQFEKSLEMANFYYFASGISNNQNNIEKIKIESISWKGSSTSPFKKKNNWIEVAKVRKKRKLRKIKKLFRKT